MQPKRTKPEDYWQSESFVRKYVYNNVVVAHKNTGASEFAASCFMAIMQGINYVAGKPAAVLDAGCGHAVRSLAIKANIGCRVVGCDYSEPMLEAARSINEQAPDAHRIELVHGDVNALPFADGEFDVAVTYGLLMSLPDAKPGVAELLRVVKSGLVLIEESGDVMTPEQRSSVADVNRRVQPGRVYWHDYLALFGRCSQFISSPLPVPDSWDLGVPPGYVRMLVLR